MIVHHDIRVLGHLGQQRAFDFETGNVFEMQDPELGMAAFFTPQVFAIGILVEIGAPINDLVHAVAAFGHHRTHDIFVAEAVARD